MIGWHHQLYGHEFGWTPGVGDGQGGLVCAVHGVTKSWTRLSDQTTITIWKKRYVKYIYIHTHTYIYITDSLSYTAEPKTTL